MYDQDGGSVHTPIRIVADEREQLLLGRLLLVLVADCTTIIIHSPEEFGDDTTVTVYRRNGSRVTVPRDCLVSAIQQAAGEYPQKTCRKCHEEKPLDQFPRDAQRPDGRFVWCDVCMRKKTREWSRRKRQGDE